jgi:prophage regulatory protein
MENNEITFISSIELKSIFSDVKQFLMLKIYLITQGSRNPISIYWFIPTLSHLQNLPEKFYFERKKIDEWLLKSSNKSNDEVQQEAIEFLLRKKFLRLLSIIKLFKVRLSKFKVVRMISCLLQTRMMEKFITLCQR